LIDRADFEDRIAKALYRVRWRQAGNVWQPTDVRVAWTTSALKQAAQIADQLPGLFRDDDIELAMDTTGSAEQVDHAGRM
jgi:hypothetical protein